MAAPLTAAPEGKPESGSVEVRVLKVEPEARVPAYQSAGAAGLDLCAWFPDENARTIEPGARMLVGTGLAIALPVGYEAQVRPRSGLALKHGVTVLNSPGTIDSDYRGSIGIVLINHGEQPFVLRRGERIAQLVIAKVERAVLVEVDSLDSTSRGAGGYGSTGR